MPSNERIGTVPQETAAESLEKEIRQKIGIIALKPDAIEAGAGLVILDRILERFEDMGKKVHSSGFIVRDGLTEEEVRRMYPNLEKNYFDPFVKLFETGTLNLIIFETDEPFDIWEALKQIKGRVTDVDTSIRSLIHRYGDKEAFDRVTQNVQRGALTEEDYMHMARNLVHVPEDIEEFSGMLSLIPDQEVEKIFGKDRSEELKRKIGFKAMSAEQPGEKKESLNRRESVRALIREGEDLLLIKRTRIEDGNISVYYVLPGGGIEEGEDVEAALGRELQEELSSDSKIERKLLEFSSQDKATLNVQHVYECVIPSRNVALAGPEALRQSEDNKYDLEWVPLDQARNLNIVPLEVRQLIQGLE